MRGCSSSDAQCTLQRTCRKIILQAMTMARLHCIEQLPLPSRLKNFLAEPNFMEDYDLDMPGPAPTDENITFFIRHFHYHPNHLARQIHVFPTVSSIDDSCVLIKIHHTEDCSTCQPHLLSTSTSALECFKSMQHKNVQKFYGMNSWPQMNMIHIALERTKASFFHILVNLAAEETEYLPEDVLCELFTQMVAALHYMSTEHNLFVPVTCRSFLIDMEGGLKLENPLGISHRNNSLSPQTILRTTQFGVVWSLGCVLYNMAALLTLDEENHNIPKIEHGKVETKCSSDRCDCFSSNYQPRYSKDFAELLLNCLHIKVASAWTLERLAVATGKYSETIHRTRSGELSVWLNQYFMSH